MISEDITPSSTSASRSMAMMFLFTTTACGNLMSSDTLGYCTLAPHLPQKAFPGAIGAPQLLQNLVPVAAAGGGGGGV